MTDDILSRAVQRYIDVSRAHRRTVSYAPGPMYHRKRLGRRQMTELNSYQSAGALPVWALTNAPDMMQWQWQPPKPDLWSPWPPPSPSPPPAPTPTPSIEAAAPPQEPEAALQTSQEPNTSKLVALGERQLSKSWLSLHRQLHDIRTSHVTSIQAYNDKFWDFLNQFERVLSQGELSGPAAVDIYKTAVGDMEVVGKCFPTLARCLRLCLMSRLASGIKAAEEAGHQILLRSSSMYMVQLAQLEANVYSADLLIFAMANLRPGLDRKHYDIVLKTLDQFFDLWRGSELHGEPQDYDWSDIAQSSQLAKMWAGRLDQIYGKIEALAAYGQVQEASRQLAKAKRCFARAQRFTLKSAHLLSSDSIIAEKIARSLQGNPKQYRVLFTQATRLLGDQKTTWSRAKYNWLQVMARLPTISSSQFSELLNLFPCRGHAALSHTELCNLLLLRWESTGKIPSDGAARRIWKEHRGDKDCTALAALALAVNKTTSPKLCTASFWQLWDILRVQGRSRVFLRQLELLSQGENLSDGFHRRLAWTSNDPCTALLINSLSKRRGISGDYSSSWGPAFWDKFVGKSRKRWKYTPFNPVHLLRNYLGPDRYLDPSHHHHDYLGEMDTQPPNTEAAPSHSPTARGQKNHEDTTRRKRFQQQVERLKFGMRLLVNARQVTDRQALRVLAQFTAILANKQGYLSARDLASLTSVMMRTLDKGACGSKQRFRWFLGVICRFLGEDACIQVGLILARRRKMNWLAWRGRMLRTGTTASQTLHPT